MPPAGLNITIRSATPRDAAALAAIYSHHALRGTATFDLEGRSLTEWTKRTEAASTQSWPFLVAEEAGAVIGYAYAAPFRDRPGYAFTCENSIYVDHRHVGRGVGRALLAELIEAARGAGFRQMIAVISGGEPASVALHRAAGFHEAGRMRSVGRKFGRWLDTVYMQRPLGEGDTTQPAGLLRSP
jgi:phosphinothricin acetyltransferase